MAHAWTSGSMLCKRAHNQRTRITFMSIRNYSLEVIIEFLKFANKNKIHVLFDEIYALSVFDHELKDEAYTEQPAHDPFISVLSLPNLEQYCDKELIHVAYGMSKVSLPKSFDLHRQSNCTNTNRNSCFPPS